MVDGAVSTPGVYAHLWVARLTQQLAAGSPQVLVTVLDTRGSAPRDAGARMWVGVDTIVDTIGGGHLEWKAMAVARDMLRAGRRQAQIRRYPLGPGLGQCCGGVVWLLFEYLDHHDAPWCQQVVTALSQGHSVYREVQVPPVPERVASHLDGGPGNRQGVAHTRQGVIAEAGGRAGSPPTDAPLLQFERADDVVCVMHAAGGRASAQPTPTTRTWQDGCFVDIWKAPHIHVVVCGAGHIGHAIVDALAGLPLQVVWLDPRDDVWPAHVPPGVSCLQGDADDVPDLPDNAYWLVLTHNHALDLAIVDAVLGQKPFAFLGLIGSKSKRARFVSRLSRKYSPDQLARLRCPIGTLPTRSKLPAVIAVSVAAQLVALMAENGQL